MTWLRRIASAPLLLLALICLIGTVKIFTHQLPDESTGTGIFTAILAVVTGGGAFYLLRPDLLRLRDVTFAEFRQWATTNPLGQAIALYVIAAVLMVAMPEYQLAPGLLAMCVYSIVSPWTTASRQRWWAYAGVALLGFCLLFFALAGTAEAIRPRGFGEAGMLFLLPMYGFPILLIVSGVVRLVRGARES
jgi:hypothetical protein